jgi:mannose-6-phosphate isomerase-like protein (cupin superfamily)
VSGYAIVHVDEVPELEDGREPMRPVRHHLGITGFGVTAWTARNAGDRVINEHQEAEAGEEESERNEELYLVLRGHAVFELDGDRKDAPAGTFVFVRPRVKRTAFAEEPGTTIVAVGGTPGKPYDPVGWELWAPFIPRYNAGEYAEVIEDLRPVAEANPQYGLLFFNLACLESLTGQKEAALADLRRSIEVSDRFREYAKGDTDLDAIRGEPEFNEIVGD